MIPYTVSISDANWRIDKGIPVSTYKNHVLYLPDGRRLMAKKMEFATYLKPVMYRMFFNIPVDVTIVYAEVMFPEGEQPWVQISEKFTGDQFVLVYFDGQLTSGTIEPVVNEFPPADLEQISWMLPFRESYKGSASSHGGLAVLSPGQVASLMIRSPNSEIKTIRVIANQHAGQPHLWQAT